MKKSFLICSLVGRMEDVLALISSLEKYHDWYLYLVLQKYPADEIQIINMHCQKVFPARSHILKTDMMTGPHLARCIALDLAKSDVWCILDDDMLAVDGFTNYDLMADIVFKNKHIGLLSSNWRKTQGMLNKVKLQDSLIKQPIVYTGGGMMLRQDVANIIRNIPRTQYLFDNPLWSIYAYVNGFENYRWLGSAAIHRICAKGGRRKWIAESDTSKKLPPKEWIRTRKGKSKQGFDEYLICDSNDVTDEAKRLHEINKKV